MNSHFLASKMIASRPPPVMQTRGQQPNNVALNTTR